MASQESLPPFITAGKVYNIKFGKSLIDKPRRKHDHSYQSISFDFKPISLNATKAAKLSVNHEDQSLSISVPRESSAAGKQNTGAEAVESTLFKGPKRPYQKDFVLVWNHNSGEITLERLECTSALKQKRTGNWPPPASNFSMVTNAISAPTKPKAKGKVKKSETAGTCPPLAQDSPAPVATNSNKPTLSGFVAGPNLESVRNSSADPTAPTATNSAQADSDSDSDSSSSSNSSSSTSDSSDSSDDSTLPKHALDIPALIDTHQQMQEIPQYMNTNKVELSASGSDSN